MSSMTPETVKPRGKKPSSGNTLTVPTQAPQSLKAQRPSNPAPLTSTPETQTPTPENTQTPTQQEQTPVPKPRWQQENIGAKREAGKRKEKDKVTHQVTEVDTTDLREEEEEEEKKKDVESNPSGFHKVGEDEHDGPSHEAETGVRKTETEEVTNDDGVEGHKTTRERNDTVGIQTSQESKSRKSVGGTVTTTEVTKERLEGAQAKLESVLTKYSNGDIEATFEAIARAGAFGEVAAEKVKKNGPYSVWAKGKAEGGAGVQTSLEGSASIQKNGRFRYEIAAALEGAAKVGLWGEASGEIGLTAGPLTAKLYAEVEAWAGAKAEFKAEVFASKAKGIGAEMEASAQAGAGASGKAGANLDLGPVGFDMEVFGEAFAGAEANFKAGFKVGLSNISGEFEVSAFAGARASAGAEGGIRIRGRKILSMKGEVTVMAGVGGKTRAKFGVGSGMGSDDNLKESADIADDYDSDKDDPDEVKAPFEVNGKGAVEFGVGLQAALGLGAGVDVEGSFDYGSVGELIAAELYERGRSSEDKKYDTVGAKFERTELPEGSPMAKRYRTRGYNAVYQTFKDYATKKITKGDHGVKEGKIRGFVADAMPLYRQYLAYKEFDRGIEDAIYAAFPAEVDSVTVDAGAITELKMLDPESPTAMNLKAELAEEQGWADARDKLTNKFVDYAVDLEKATKGGAEKKKVQTIIDDQMENITKAFTKKAPEGFVGPMQMTAKPSEVINFAAEKSGIQKYFQKWGVDDQGKLSAETVADSAAADKIRKAYAGGKQVNETVGKIHTARVGIKELIEERLKDPRGAAPTAMEINAILVEELTDVPAEVVANSEFQARVRMMLAETLGGDDADNVNDDLFEPGTLELYKGRWLDPAKYKPRAEGMRKIRTARASKAAATSKKRATKSLSNALGQYYTEKLSKGNNGVNLEGVNKRIKEALPAMTQEGGQLADVVADIKRIVDEVYGTSEMEHAGGKGVEMNGLTATVRSLPQKFIDANKADKTATKEYGKRTLKDKDGELDNTRRSMVHVAMRGPLDKYRAALDKDLLAPPSTKSGAQPITLNTAKLQSIVDKTMSSHDLRNDVAKAAVVREITERFSDVIETVTLTDSYMLMITQKSGWQASVKADLEKNKPSKEAEESLASYVSDLWRIGSRQSDVQKKLDKVYASLPGATNAAKDEKAMAIIRKALPRVTFANLYIFNGQIVSWKVIGS